jgi:hypothetical protein
MIGRVWMGFGSWGLGRATAVVARRRAVGMRYFMLGVDVVVVMVVAKGRSIDVLFVILSKIFVQKQK